MNLQGKVVTVMTVLLLGQSPFAAAYEQNAEVLSSGGGVSSEGRYVQFGVIGQGLLGDGMGAATGKNYPGITGVLTAGPDPAVTHFADVANSYWAHIYIESIYAIGITTGCGSNPQRYCPTGTVTRAQMAVFLERGIHGSAYAPTGTGIVFADVAANYWADGYVEAMYTDGITGGCGTSPLRFCPDTIVTRAQMAVFLLRAKYGSAYVPPLAKGLFADVATNHWAAGWIEQLYTEGVTTGCGSNPLRFCPDTNVNRDQMAVFLTRTFGLP
jgi:hypothetical protein